MVVVEVDVNTSLIKLELWPLRCGSSSLEPPVSSRESCASFLSPCKKFVLISSNCVKK